MKKRKTGRSSSSATIVGTVALVALGAGALFFGLSRRSPQAPTPVNAAPPAQATSASGQGDQSQGVLPLPQIQPQEPKLGSVGGSDHPVIAVYSVASNEDGDHLEKRVLPPSAVHGSSDAERAVHALNAMATQSKSPLPEGTRALSVQFGSDGVATVNFNKAFHDNFHGGDEGDALTLNAVLATIGQFPGVRSVQFLVEGQKVDSLGGTESLMQPLPVPQTLTAGGEPPAAVAKSEP